MYRELLGNLGYVCEDDVWKSVHKPDLSVVHTNVFMHCLYRLILGEMDSVADNKVEKESINCFFCGYLIEDDSGMCDECGTSIEETRLHSGIVGKKKHNDKVSDKNRLDFIGMSENQKTTKEMSEFNVKVERNKWKCEKCEYENNYDDTKCFICCSRSHNEGEWICDICLSENRAMLTLCDVCGYRLEDNGCNLGMSGTKIEVKGTIGDTSENNTIEKESKKEIVNRIGEDDNNEDTVDDNNEPLVDSECTKECEHVEVIGTTSICRKADVKNVKVEETYVRRDITKEDILEEVINECIMEESIMEEVIKKSIMEEVINECIMEESITEEFIKECIMEEVINECIMEESIMEEFIRECIMEEASVDVTLENVTMDNNVEEVTMDNIVETFSRDNNLNDVTSGNIAEDDILDNNLEEFTRDNKVEEDIWDNNAKDDILDNNLEEFTNEKVEEKVVRGNNLEWSIDDLAKIENINVDNLNYFDQSICGGVFFVDEEKMIERQNKWPSEEHLEDAAYGLEPNIDNTPIVKRNDDTETFVSAPDIVDERWTCPQCSYFNKMESVNCAVCENEAPHKNKWRCDKCTCINDRLALQCLACCSYNVNLAASSPNNELIARPRRKKLETVHPSKEKYLDRKFTLQKKKSLPRSREWTCKYCNQMNDYNNEVCGTCNNRNPGPCLL